MTRPSLSLLGNALLVVVLLVSTASIPIAAQTASANDVQIRGIEHAGPGVVATESDRTYITAWQPSNVTVTIGGESGTYSVCTRVQSGPNSATQLGCRQINSNGGQSSVTFNVEQWPTNETGSQQLVVEVFGANGTNSLAQTSRSLTVFPPEGDADDDGLANQRELEYGTDIRESDTDGDGLSDGAEVNNYETNPTDPDSDGDGLSDGVEVNEFETNPNETDTDGDGLTDGKEVTTYNTDPTKADSDGDGLSDGEEVNEYETDPNVADSDEDGLSDGEEVNQYETNPTKADTDEDGLSDGEEVNQYETNPTKADTDEDGLGDGKEVNEYDTDPNDPDTDGDGVGDGTEVERGTNPNTRGGRSIGLPGADVRISTLVMLGAILLVGLVAGAVLARRHSSLSGLVPGVSKRDRDDGPAEFPTPRNDGGDETADETADEDADGATADDTQEQEQAEEEESPLSDEERVLYLLDQHNGQLRQSAVVDGTGWSKSKVSRVLSRMADEGTIEKINIGRENIIARPESVPDHARSQSDDL
ncbi:helix-turn-helix transcriptional regulator [Haloarcula amylovorans]|uniref:helix-turn-helix transcriptional regulator n=1 Tax=Haloarcula amylovorans TaxID=2562280 RepID=UPI001076A8BB|nr:binary toxin-like calcium binding domain-containing protein [Halomicroarcula amylolytica]